MSTYEDTISRIQKQAQLNELNQKIKHDTATQEEYQRWNKLMHFFYPELDPDYNPSDLTSEIIPHISY